MPVPIGLVNSYNAEEQLQRGYIPEVAEFLSSAGGRSLDAVRFDSLSGQVLLERGDFRGAAPRLERALAGTGRRARASACPTAGSSSSSRRPPACSTPARPPASRSRCPSTSGDRICC